MRLFCSRAQHEMPDVPALSALRQEAHAVHVHRGGMNSTVTPKRHMLLIEESEKGANCFNRLV